MNTIKKRRPNILFIISDDHNASVMGCSGNKYIKTPNMDRLAKSGVRFTNSFTTSGLCSPSRASFLTGKYSHQCSAPDIIGMNNTFHANEKSFPGVLKRAGYKSAHIGKWHLGDGHKPKENYDYWASFRWLGEFYDPSIHINGEEKSFKGYVDDVLTDLAVDYIKKESRDDKPFCLFLGLKAPHMPFSYPKRHENALDDIDIPKPDNFNEDYSKSKRPDIMKNCLIRIEEFDRGLKLFDNSWGKYIKSYYRAVMSIDDNLGRILDVLKEEGIEDDTFIIYTSDQGYNLGTHGLTEKHFAYEEVMRIPMIMRYPKLIKENSTIDEAILNIDMVPTIYDLCNLDVVDDEISGKSIMPLLRSENTRTKPFREDFMFEYWSNEDRVELPAQIAYRTTKDPKQKLIKYQYFPINELYMLNSDPNENENVASLPKYKKDLKKLENKLDKFKSKLDWEIRKNETIKTIYISELLDDKEAKEIRKDIKRCSKLSYTKLCANEEGIFKLTDDLNKKAKIMYIKIPIELISKKDPHCIMSFEPNRKIKAYMDNKLMWDSKMHWHNKTFNPPLSKGSQNIYLEIEVFDSDTIKIIFNAPKNTVKLY